MQANGPRFAQEGSPDPRKPRALRFEQQEDASEGDSDSDSGGDDGLDSRQRQLLSQGWAGGKEAYSALQRYMFETGKSCKLGTKAGAYRTVVCTTAGCTFKVSLAKHKSKSDSTWHIVSKSALSFR